MSSAGDRARPKSAGWRLDAGTRIGHRNRHLLATRRRTVGTVVRIGAADVVVESRVGEGAAVERYGRWDGIRRTGGRALCVQARSMPSTGSTSSPRPGADVNAVQRMLGHASTAMTLDAYSGGFGDDLGALAQRMDTAHGAHMHGDLCGRG